MMRRQRGATLVIALIMLLLMMIHALASFTVADTQLRNAGNLQTRQEAHTAAQQAIAGVIGSSTFLSSSAASPIDVDIDGDGTPDYRVTVSASCVGARVVTSLTIPAASADDAACLAAVTPSGDIPCAETAWNVRAVATRPAQALQSGVTVEINQGLAVRLENSDALRNCPGLSPTVPVAASALSLTRARHKTYWFVRPGT